jgi:hypothetical protein
MTMSTDALQAAPQLSTEQAPSMRSRAVELAARKYTAPMIEAQLLSEGHLLADVRSTLSTVETVRALEAPRSDSTRARARSRGFWHLVFGVAFLLGGVFLPVGVSWLFFGGVNLALGVVSLNR